MYSVLKIGQFFFFRRVVLCVLLVAGMMGFNELRASSASKQHAHAIDMTQVIFGHTGNGHSFHFFTYNGVHYGLPLPVILYVPGRGFTAFMSHHLAHEGSKYKGYMMQQEAGNERIVAVNAFGKPDLSVKVYDISITRNVAQMFLVGLLMFYLLRKVGVRYKGKGYLSAPKGLNAWIEPVVEFIVKEVAVRNLGEKKGAVYAPFLLSVFFFILANNLVGLIPSAANVTGNISFTFTLAVVSFILTMLNARSYYWKHIFAPPAPLAIKFILIPVEIVGIFTKPFALMIRLFANMLAGHIVIICFISLIFILYVLNEMAGRIFVPVSIAFTVFIYLIELLVTFIQAYIFANLTALFIAQAGEKSH